MGVALYGARGCLYRFMIRVIGVALQVKRRMIPRKLLYMLTLVFMFVDSAMADNLMKSYDLPFVGDRIYNF